MLAQGIAVINGKGGVGKTSITANFAGLAAAAGYRVLAVDMDPQGNLGWDLGYRQSGASDKGLALFESIMRGHPVKPLVGIRENLDVAPGGSELEHLVDYLRAKQMRGTGPGFRALADVIAPIAANYHLIVVDTPPGERLLQQLSVTAVRCIVIPTKSDEASFDGLEKVSELYAWARNGTEQVRPVNPELEVLGVAVFGVGSSARAIRREARQQVAAELDSEETVFQTTVRHVELPARECRQRGLLAHELEAQTTRVRSGEEEPRSAASGLASDYASLTAEILERWSQLQQRAVVGTAVQ